MDSSLKFFNRQKASFGRHETFALRYSWLTKGFQAFKRNPAIFSSDEATIDLGVGKNMVHAIKYWLCATTMLKDSTDGLIATELGEALLAEKDGWDPYLEDEATIWLLHWLLVSNAELATAWYWFFNCFHRPEFTSEEAADALDYFVKNKLSGKHSEKTVRQEIALILRMYSPPKLSAKADIEDGLDAPLSALKLVAATESTHLYRSASAVRPHLPISVIGYAINEIFNRNRSNMVSINELMYSQKHGVALGGVFRLTEKALLAKLENLVAAYPQNFQLNETAGIHQLAKIGDDMASLDFLRHYYPPKA